MNSPSSPTRYLLDKNVVRLVVVGLSLNQQLPFPPPVLNALTFWRTAERQGFELCITDASIHILKLRRQHAAARFVLATTTEIGPGRYCQRWARRLRETTGLTYEDAMVLALGTFGTDKAGAVLGAQAIVTYDQSLVNGYYNHLATLERRLKAMQAQLFSPFSLTKLPRVVHPDDFLTPLAQ